MVIRERIISPFTLFALSEVVEVGMEGEGALVVVPTRLLSGCSRELASLLFFGTSEPASRFLPAAEPLLMWSPP